MKLKNILSVICILVAMSSCSMEDDILNDVESKLQDLNPDREAILSFHLSSNTLLTKSVGTATGDSVAAEGLKETKLNNCVLALMQDTTVLSVVTSEDISDGKVNGVTFLTKVRSGLSVIAIVNVNVADFPAYEDAKTRSELNQVIDVDPNGKENLVKQGEAEIKFPAGFGSSSTAQTADNTLSVTIPVTQLAAKIELSEFNVKYAEGVQKKSKVTLTSVSFENLNKKSMVFDEHALESGSKSFNDLDQLLAEGADQNNEIEDCFAYSYENTTDGNSPVQMTLTFRIGEESSMQAETVTKTYLINRNNASEEDDERGVKRGHLYRVKVNMTINTVDMDVVCYTNDWILDEDTFNGVQMTPAN